MKSSYFPLDSEILILVEQNQALHISNYQENKFTYSFLNKIDSSTENNSFILTCRLLGIYNPIDHLTSLSSSR